MSCIGQANKLLYGLPRSLLDKILYIQNIATHVVAQEILSKHITPVLKILYWLSYDERIDFKVLILVYKAIH